jgi:hypothetical protein
MNHLSGENRVSLKVDRFLNHKYRSDLSTLGELNEENFMQNWRERLKSGCIDGIFWVAAGRRDLSEKTLCGIYGDVHMASHAGVSEIMKSRQEVKRQTEALQKILRLLNQEKQGGRELKKKNSLMKKNLHDTLMNLEKFKSLRKSEESELSGKNRHALEEENRILRQKLCDIEREHIHLTDQSRILERENRHLQIDFFEIQSTNQRLANELKDLLSQMGRFFECNSQCDAHCAKFQLCARKVLIVGGITKMKHLYRDLIESCGGEFEYHDGYLKAGIKKLEAQVERSDLVLCPVNCNSHGACKKVKSLCKKLNKPVKMLPKSSLSIISSTLLNNSTQWTPTDNDAPVQ